jgi:hypothetical protein
VREIEQLRGRALDLLDSGAISQKTPQAQELEAQGAEAWLRTLGARTFTGSFADFHRRMWNWYWQITMKRLRGLPLTNDELVFLAIWFRGGGKSANVEWACIAEGALLGTGYVMYVSDTEGQAKDHVAAIRKRLESSEIAEYYPGLGLPEVGKHGAQVGWRQDYLATASGWGIIPVGLDQGIRGGRKDDLRFTMIVLDDVDDHKDSPAAVEKKLDIISRSILPAGQRDTIVLFAQNLIHQDSTLNQIVTRRSDVLSERIISGPVPAFTELDLELKDGAQGRVWGIKHCVPTWPDIDLEAARRFLSRSGRASFLAEYQHDFADDRTELVLNNWDDSVHVIRRSDFARVFGTPHIPAAWNKYVAHDWARTKTQYHANVLAKIAVSSQNSRLPGRVFLYDVMSFPAQTEPEDVAVRFLKSLTPASPDQWDDVVRATVSRADLERYIHNTTRLIEARRDVLADVIPDMVSPILEAQNFVEFRMSHEAKTQREIYDKVFGLPFTPMNPGEDGGVAWINHYLQVNYEADNPFLSDRKGAAGFYLVVDDDKYLFPSSITPDSLHDADLARYQFKHWRYRAPKLTEAGMTEHSPQKSNDDVGNALMMIFVDNAVQSVPLTKEETRIAQLPAELKPEAVMAKAGTAGFVEDYVAQQHALTQIRLREEADEKEAQKAWSRAFGGRPAQHRRYRR